MKIRCKNVLEDFRSVIIIFLLSNSLCVNGQRCTGSPNCRICTDCSRCKYCNSGGGSCGVCGGGKNYNYEPSKNVYISRTASHLRLIKVKNANVRNGPSKYSTILGTVPKFTKISILYSIGDWYCVQIGTLIAYIHNSLFQ